VLRGALCTAYAVGPHTLLTAEHCNLPDTNAVYLDSVDHDAIKQGRVTSHTIISRTFDHQDHMLLDVSAVIFGETIELGAHVRTAKQGEKIYFWGTPDGIPNMYREGYVMGAEPPSTPDPEDKEPIDATAYLTIAACPTISGDSGSAVFAEKDGQLVGVVTYGVADGMIMGMFPIQFTQAQIEAAKN
jgi:V8-like Glu-specific endopeptidase